MSTELRDYVAKGSVDETRVLPATFERLRVMVGPHGWTPMMSDSGDGTYRAWMRRADGSRMFGRPAQSAESAALALIAKVEPMTRRAS